MRKLSVTLALSFALSSSALRQQPLEEHPFSFKEAYLGMSLSEFKWLNEQDVFIYTDDHEDKKAKTKSKPQQVRAPLCTDEYDFGVLVKTLNFSDKSSLAPIAPPQSGEVVCFTTSHDPKALSLKPKKSKQQKDTPGWDPKTRTVAGMDTVNLHYRFYDGKLYRIHMWFPASAMTKVNAAFIQKYGPPQDTNREDFGDSYGNTWQGLIYSWQLGDLMLTMRMGSGFGPGQDLYHFNGTSSIDFIDEKIAKTLPITSRTKLENPKSDGSVSLDF
jgi:hypothetical protein